MTATIAMVKSTTKAKSIGAPLSRKEDYRLLTGLGEYTADYIDEDMCHSIVVRSPHAHAQIRSIDISSAILLPGVLTILSGRDLRSDGIRPIPHNAEWSGAPDAEIRLPDDFEVFTPEHFPLALDFVRFVGEPVALVVAETEAQAILGAEAVSVLYEELPAVVDSRKAIKIEAPVLWRERNNNISLECEVGDSGRTNAAFAKAAHVVKFDSWVQRITGSPMEPRASIGSFNKTTGHYTLRSASGRGAVQTRERLAFMLGVPLESCRVIFGDMGGNFGTRNAFSSEAFLMPWASRFVGRPVKWTASRSECFLSDYQGRDLFIQSELALDEDGKFLGLRGTNISNLGAYVAYFWPLRKGLSLMQSVYNIPAVHFKGLAVFTNTPPTAVYRSAGRPEAIYAIERLIDLAAAECGFDRIDLRKINIIQKDALPFKTAVGVTYDSGDYTEAMGIALDKTDLNGFELRKLGSKERGLCRGWAIANYIEVTSGIPRERAELRVCRDGKIELVVGTMSSGQGHETSYAQVVSDWLGVPFDSVRFIANDTDRVTVGGGSHSGRSMRLVSIAIGEAVKDLIDKGKAVVANMLSTSELTITYEDSYFWAPNNQRLSLLDVAEAMVSSNSRPTGQQADFEGIGDITNRVGGYPYGAHACEVEVDPETGVVEIVSWSGVDDVGLAVNPLILHGQAHGAITQGIGQALLENMNYDPQNAQLLSGSFMDYAMPRAINIPSMETIITENPASSHPYGIRPGGEGGTTPALGLVINAIVDALSIYGVRHIEMPATSERVWRAIHDNSR